MLRILDSGDYQDVRGHVAIEARVAFEQREQLLEDTVAAAMELFRDFMEEYYKGKYEFQGRSIGIELSYVALDLVITSAPSEAAAVDLPELTEELRVGTRALEGLEGFEWSGDMVWIESLKEWGLPCRISLRVPCSKFVPTDSAWWIRIDTTYSAGRLEFYPAKEDGSYTPFRINGTTARAIPV